MQRLEVRSLLTGFVDLGPVHSVAGINSSGEVIGQGSNGLAFLRDADGGMTTIEPLPGDTTTTAVAINDSGQVAGNSDPGAPSAIDVDEAFFYSDGSVTALKNLGGQSILGEPYSTATAINASGQVVGYSLAPDKDVDAFLWSPTTGNMQNLASEGFGAVSTLVESASGINSMGQVVGSVATGVGASDQAILWSGPDNGTYLPASGLGGSSTEPKAINVSGDVVGRSTTTSDVWHAFLWSPSTPTQKMTDLGTLSGYSDYVATGINDSGVIVGQAYNTALLAPAPRAFIYVNGQMEDLTAYYSSEIPTGWVLNSAVAINDSGEIVGMATNPAGQAHGYLFQPSATTGTQPTTTFLQVSAASAVYGQQVTLTATVSPGNGATATPTGSVTFADGSMNLGTASLIGDTATLPVADLPVGTDAITANYNGDSNFTTSSASASVSVQQDGTFVSLKGSADSASVGQNIVLTAIVSPASPGGGTPSGSVTFTYAGGSLGTAPLIGGTAALSTASLPVGTDTITATYGGDRDFLGNHATLTITITKPARPKFGTQTILTSSARATAVGKRVTLTATVKNASRIKGTPTGSAIFELNGKPFTVALALRGGKVKLTTTALPLGTDDIEVIYSGDQNFAASISPLFVETISAAPKKPKKPHG